MRIVVGKIGSTDKLSSPQHLVWVAPVLVRARVRRAPETAATAYDGLVLGSE